MTEATNTESPGLEQRIRTAVQNVANVHSCMYQEGIDVDEMVAAVLAVLPPAVGAVVRHVPVVGETDCAVLSPMISLLSDGEDPGEPPTWPAGRLTVDNRTPPLRYTACRSGRHADHPGETCEEMDDDLRAASDGWDGMFRDTFPDYLAFGFTFTSIVPTALRGPNWPRDEGDPEPLRKLAEEALAQGGPLPGVRPYSEVKVEDGLIPELLASDSVPLTGEGLYDQIKAVFGVPLPPYTAQPVNACPCGGGEFNGERIHAPDCPVHPMRLRAVEGQATALLPQEVRDAVVRFEFATEAVCPARSAGDQGWPCTLPAHHGGERRSVGKLGTSYWHDHGDCS